LITDHRQQIAVSNLGWVDHGSLWRFDSASSRVERIQLSDATHLVLQNMGDDEFTAVHHFDGSRVEITSHAFANPGDVLRRVAVPGWAPEVDGRLAPWPQAVSHFVTWLSDAATGAAGYYLISVTGRGATIDRLDWFDANSYDLDYQSVIAVGKVPESGELVFGVQRSSDLVVISPAHSGAVRRVGLNGGYGNAVPYVRATAPEVWAVDYDTLVRLDRRTWAVTGAIRLQDAPEGTRMFVGDLWWPPDEGFAIVPRPGSADVTVIDPATMTLTRTVPLGRQPLVAVVVDRGFVVARDWKTGDLLHADLS
jgi:YVTN family beta-propeller protein